MIEEQFSFVIFINIKLKITMLCSTQLNTHITQNDLDVNSIESLMLILQQTLIILVT